MGDDDQAHQLRQYLTLSDDDLIELAALDAVRHGFMRNRLNLARRKVLATFEVTRNHVCSNEAVRRAHVDHADDQQLIAALLVALPVPFLKEHGISDALAFSILVLRSGLSNLCGSIWSDQKRDTH